MRVGKGRTGAWESGRAEFYWCRFPGGDPHSRAQEQCVTQPRVQLVSRARVVDDESGRLWETKRVRMIAREASGKLVDGARHVSIGGSTGAEVQAAQF